MATINTNLAGVTSGSQYASAGNNTIYTNLPFNTAGTTATNVTFLVGASSSIDILYNQNFRVDSTTGFHELFGNIEVQGVSSDYTVSSWYGKVVLTHKTSGQVISFQLTKPQNAASNSGVNVEFLDGAIAFTSNVNGQGVWTVWATKGGTDTSTWGAGGLATQVPGTYSPGATPLDLSVASDVGYLNYSVNSSDVSNWTGEATTYTLTTGVDTLNIAASNVDVRGVGVVESTNGTFTTGTTFNTADTIAATGSNESLSLTIDGVTKNATTSDLPAASVSGVQTLNLRSVASGSGAIGVSGSNFSGLTQFNNDRSSTAVVATKLASGTGLGVIGNGIVTNGATSAEWVAGATSSTVAISGGTTGGDITMTGTGLKSLAITSSGAVNTVGTVTAAATVTATTITANTALAMTTLDVTAAGTLTVTGAASNIAATSSALQKGAVQLGTLDAALTKVDASGLTNGGIEAIVGAVTQAITGGQGADIITTNGALTTGSVGAGLGRDTLVVAATADLNTAALGAKYTGFEILRAGDSVDVSLVSGIDALELNAMTSKTVSQISAVQAGNIRVLGDQTTALTLSLKDYSGASDSASLNLQSATSTTHVDIAGLSVIGVETLNIAAASGTGGVSDVAFAASGADKLTAITVTGSSKAGVSGTNTSKALTLDGTANTGGMVISGDFVKASTLKGSLTASNTITVGNTLGNGSTYIGGGKNDTFSVADTLLEATGSGDNVLTAGDGVDTLTITNAMTLVDNDFTYVSGFEKLSTALTSAVSVSSLGAGFNAAFATGVTITTGTLANNATYNTQLGLYTQNVTQTLTSSGDGASNADNITIVTGSGSDTVTVTAGSWIGTNAVGGGVLQISTGAGVDTITVTHGTLANANTAVVSVTGGLGADIISLAGVNGTSGTTTAVVIAAGDSTTTAWDQVTGFDAGTATLYSSTLDFSAAALHSYSATAAAGYTFAEFNVTVGAAGAVTFAGTLAGTATLAMKINAVQSVVTANAGDTAVWMQGSDAFIFNNNASGDSLVQLVGTTVSSLITTNAATADAVFIA